MKKRHGHRVVEWAAVIALVWLLSGCVTASEPLYQGDRSKEPTNMKDFEDGPVRMRIPQGYVTKPIPPNSDERFQTWLKKEGSPAELQIYCFGGFLNKGGVRLQLLRIGEAVMPNAVQIMKPHTMGTSNLSAVMEAYTGTITAQGQEVPMNFYLAWKLNSRFGGCKYGLLAVTSKNSGDEFFPEFVAMVRSLQ